MKTLEDALVLAATAHKGQQDKAGEPYILHPLRLMLSLNIEQERMVALLHDIVEDTAVTLQQLEEEGYPPAVIEAVALLTHAEDVSYMDYVAQIKTNPLARAVKLADLRDNMNLSRLKEPTPKDHARLEKYQRAQAFLLADEVDVAVVAQAKE